ncbi:helicase-associated domain-containing protein [Cohnella sp. 56]|uniref:helicase-associated domain-containing protein n=1 Tax=Cohnella sp. 56 TaxID=3113722 RepID=UPI0030E8C4F3
MLDKKQTEKLARHWQIAMRASTPVEEMREKLVKAYFTEERILEQLRKLDAPERQSLDMLAAVAEMNGGRPSRTVDAARSIDRLTGGSGNGSKVIETLKKSGFVFTVKEYWHEFAVVPLELVLLLYRELTESSAERILKNGAVEGEVRIEEQCGLALAHDLLTLLSAIGHERVEVSQKGLIYKRAMNRILPKLRSSDDYFPDIGIDEARPAVFVFLESFIHRYNMANFREVACLNPAGIEPFLNTPYSEWQRLFIYHYESVLPPAGRLPMLLVRSIVYRFGLDDWISADAVRDELARLMEPWEARLDDEMLDEAFYMPHIAVGLIECGRDASDRPVWRWTDWGREFVWRGLLGQSLEESRLEHMLADRFYVQPNLEIVMPETALPAIRWRVEAIAELVRSDSALTYKLTRERAIQALEGGWTIDEIEAFLTEFSQTPVAPSVLRTLRDWTASYGSAVLWDAMVLQVADPAAAQLIARDKKLAALIVHTFSPDTFVIRRHDEQEVRKLVAKLGYNIPVRHKNPDRAGLSGGKRVQRQRQGDDGTKQIEIANLEAFAPRQTAGGLVVGEMAYSSLQREAPNFYDDAYEDEDEDEGEDDFDGFAEFEFALPDDD